MAVFTVDHKASAVDGESADEEEAEAEAEAEAETEAEAEVTTEKVHNPCKRSVSVSVDLDELLRVCKKAAIAMAVVAYLLALTYFFHCYHHDQTSIGIAAASSCSSSASSSSMSLPHPSLPGVFIFLLINVGVVSLAISSGILNGHKARTFTVDPNPDDDTVTSILGEAEAPLAYPERFRNRSYNNGNDDEENKEEEDDEEEELANSNGETKEVQNEFKQEGRNEKKIIPIPIPSTERVRSFTSGLFRSSSDMASHPPIHKPGLKHRLIDTGSFESHLRKNKVIIPDGKTIEEEEALATATSSGRNDVDKQADDFITRFYQQMKAQRIESFLRYRARREDG